MTERDPVRPILGFLTFGLLYYVGLMLALPIVRYLGGEMTAITVTPLLVAAVANTLLFAMFEQKGLTSAGLDWESGSLQNLLLGTGICAVCAVLVILVPVWVGMAHFESVPKADTNWRAALFMPVLIFCGAAGEELAFRGFPLQFLMRGYGKLPAIVGIGITFGLLHSGNEGANPLGIVNTIGFGILFGFALLRSHDLWFPIGLHFGWNATLPYLGTELSGLTIRVVDYKLVWKAGDLWSGGKYGPEGSLLTTAVLCLLALAIWKAPVRKCAIYLLDEADSASQPELPPVS